jgi:hypothetical protein
MTTDTRPESKSPSRRALLAGAIGGLGAFAASAIGRSSRVRAGVDGDVVLGATNTASATTSINRTGGGDAFAGNSTSNDAVNGYAQSGSGIYGQSTSGSGVFGISESFLGVGGISTSYVGVRGTNGAADQPAMMGENHGNGTGVFGHSGASVIDAKLKTGVFGYAAQDSASRGVWGSSPSGHGLHGESSAGWAGYFNGRVVITKYAELVEIATPSVPGSNHARLFVRDNGSGKTQLCVRFHTGAVKVLATQP